MNDKLKIEEIKNVFDDKPFTSDDLYHFYQKYNPNLNKNTFRWRIYALKNDGVIHTLKRGVYVTKSKKDFKPVVSKKLKDLFVKVHNQFPYANMCIWETSWLNNLMLHQAFSSNIILEIDKDAASAVFAFLQESYRDVYLNLGKYKLESYSNAGQSNIVIKNLTITSPLQEVQNITVPTIEKIMVDLFVDDGLFVTYQGAELQNIYQELFMFYSVNRSKLKQYANKRHIKDKLVSFLKEETNIGEDELLI
ncbi:MAG: hypothetical protein JXQ26_00295 [Tissierellales bacterium]|jgi:hypothetical protein|nr:hypothetical protein [Tissierellales bacterium]MBN2826394.1 hypothetical protein [Tissierellales bacterium]